MKLELTEQEVQALLSLTDVALKNTTLGGWAVFNIAGVLRQKLQAAAQAEIHANFNPPMPARNGTSDLCPAPERAAISTE